MENPNLPTVATLVHAAQGYLTRRAASRLQLQRVLERKVRRRVAGAHEIDREELARLVEAAVEKIVQAGWIDDGALARTRAESLTRNGLSTSAVRQRLAQQGLSLEQPTEIDDEVQARRYAERKRLGPFASTRRAPSPDRDMRAMIRGGFAPDLSRRVLRDCAEEQARKSGADPQEPT